MSSDVKSTSNKIHKKLDEFSATAIASNDILSSSLYVCGIAIIYAGIWAPVIFILIGLVLWCYKMVYTEVVEALPLNGGAYNCLLSATAKSRAAIAGVMTVLSYIATSVISAKTASEYLHTVVHGVPVIPLTVTIIIFFGILTAIGVKDSARVAKVIFSFNIFTLLLFIALGLLQLVNNGPAVLINQWHMTQNLFSGGNSIQMLFYAFSLSLLGVSGFESSANFVEEQEPGVFRKTLKNMLLGVGILNPLIALVVLLSLDITTIKASADFVLAAAGIQLGGIALQWLIVINAFMVLSGAVLASFVGATGLLYRMTLDQCLPSNIFLPKLKKRNSNANRLIILFTILCISILLLTGGNLLSLAGVYTISFLGVMTFFALGNLILRKNRSDLKRTYKAPLIVVIAAMIATSLGIVGNIIVNPQNFWFFLIYFVPSLIFVMIMIYRDYILEALVAFAKNIPALHTILKPVFDYVVNTRVILFAHDPVKLFSSLEYIRRNETSRRITVIYCATEEHGTLKVKTFENFIETFVKAKVFPVFEITFIVEQELDFGAEVIRQYANRYRIGRNNIFIGSLHKNHPFTFEELGGVRIIQ